MKKKPLADIDAYVNQHAGSTKARLQKMREIIRQAAPDAEEKISYQMPTFFLHGNLVHFAAFKNHLGFYPTPSGISAFQKELAAYPNAKGSVQFPFDKPLPITLIRKIVKFRVAENMAKASSQKSKKRSAKQK